MSESWEKCYSTKSQSCLQSLGYLGLITTVSFRLLDHTHGRAKVQRKISGYDKTNELMEEATRCLEGVRFNPDPASEGGLQHTQQESRQYNSGNNEQDSNQYQYEGNGMEERQQDRNGGYLGNGSFGGGPLPLPLDHYGGGGPEMGAEGEYPQASRGADDYYYDNSNSKPYDRRDSVQIPPRESYENNQLHSSTRSQSNFLPPIDSSLPLLSTDLTHDSEQKQDYASPSDLGSPVFNSRAQGTAAAAQSSPHSHSLSNSSSRFGGLPSAGDEKNRDSTFSAIRGTGNHERSSLAYFDDGNDVPADEEEGMDQSGREREPALADVQEEEQSNHSMIGPSKSRMMETEPALPTHYYPTETPSLSASQAPATTSSFTPYVTPLSPSTPSSSANHYDREERPYVPKPDDGAYHGPILGAAPPSNHSRAVTPEVSRPPPTQQQDVIPPPPTSFSTPTNIPLDSVSSPTLPTSQYIGSTNAPRKSVPPPALVRGESALGSKYGDVYVSSDNTPAPVVGSGIVGTGGGGGFSGYNSRLNGDSSSTGGGDRKINAGAFRRGGAAPSPAIGAGSSAGRFQSSIGSGSNSNSNSPSQSDAIRDLYRANSGGIQSVNSPNIGVGVEDSRRGSGEGSRRVSGEEDSSRNAGPRFDLSPLIVKRERETANKRSSTLPTFGGALP